MKEGKGKKKKRKSRTRDEEIIHLGFVEVFSGSIAICDTANLGVKRGEFIEPEQEGFCDHEHYIFKHKDDNKLWQYCDNGEPVRSYINKFTGDYETIIPEYGKTPNELIEGEIFTVTDIDPSPHIKKGEFSFRGINKMLRSSVCAQLNFKDGEEGAAVAMSTGLGDGIYDVWGHVADTGILGKVLQAITIEFVSDEELIRLRGCKTEQDVIELLKEEEPDIVKHEGVDYVSQPFKFTKEIFNEYYAGNEFVGVDFNNIEGNEILERIQQGGANTFAPKLVSELRETLGADNCRYSGLFINGRDNVLFGIEMVFLIKKDKYLHCLEKVNGWKKIKELENILTFEKKNV